MSKIDVSNMDLYYGDFHALKNINLSIDANEVTAFIGPSGCGKSTLLKSINRMNDLVPVPMWRCAPGASAIRWRCTSW